MPSPIIPFTFFKLLCDNEVHSLISSQLMGIATRVHVRGVIKINISTKNINASNS